MSPFPPLWIIDFPSSVKILLPSSVFLLLTPLLFFLSAFIIFFPLLQENQRLQQKVDTMTKEVFDLQETLLWKDKTIGV